MSGSDQQLDHTFTKIANEREKYANMLSDEFIYYQTVKQALNADGASMTDKLTFALSGLPEANLNFEKTKTQFFDILFYMAGKQEIENKELVQYSNAVKNLSSITQLLTKQNYFSP